MTRKVDISNNTSSSASQIEANCEWWSNKLNMACQGRTNFCEKYRNIFYCTEKYCFVFYAAFGGRERREVGGTTMCTHLAYFAATTMLQYCDRWTLEKSFYTIPHPTVTPAS